MKGSVFDVATLHDVLRKAGRYVSPDGWFRCPSHDDDEPSAHIIGRGWHCFACSAHGGVVALIVELRLASTPAEAARWLEKA